MDRYDPATYGDRIAEVYDAWYPTMPDEAAAIETLTALANGGRVLELGIGTGRLALPLMQRGLEVHGVDASEAMVARLRAKEVDAAIPVAIGDFAGVPVEGEFALIYVAFNTFFALLTQADQARCFRNVAAHLAPAGRFVVEVFVPDLARFTANQTLRATDVGVDRLKLEATRHDPIGQRVVSQHVLIDDRGVHLYPVQLRYAWPSELDLMAQLAGLRLLDRWGGWAREPFTAASGKHVSVYGGEGGA